MAERGGQARTGALAALQYRDFALSWSGRLVSQIGDGIFTVALALEALRISHQAGLLSYVLAARTLPTVLLLLLSGAITDRVSRRLTLLLADTVQGLTVGSVALLIATGHLAPFGLVVLGALFGLADAFTLPAFTAFLPEIVPPELLLSGNALGSTGGLLAGELLGPAIGGLVVAAIGTSWSFGVDAISFGVSATCLSLVRARPKRKTEAASASARAPTSIIADAREGLQYCRSQRWLMVTIVAAGVANFAAFSPMGVLLPLLIRRVLHASPAALGLTLAFGGLGGALGSFIAGHFPLRHRRITAIWVVWTLSSACYLVIAAAPDVWVVAGLNGLVWVGLMWGNVVWGAMMQELIPSELLGRASSVDWLFSLALSPLGILAGGVASVAFGARTAILLGGAIAVVSGLGLFVPGARGPDRIVAPT